MKKKLLLFLVGFAALTLMVYAGGRSQGGG
jgi:hypothetical protein